MPNIRETYRALRAAHRIATRALSRNQDGTAAAMAITHAIRALTGHWDTCTGGPASLYFTQAKRICKGTASCYRWYGPYLSGRKGALAK